MSLITRGLLSPRSLDDLAEKHCGANQGSLTKMYSQSYYTDTRYNNKIRYTDNLTSKETLSQEVTVKQKLCRNIIIQYFKKHMFWDLLESPHRGDSNKHAKHKFYVEIKHGICCMSFCSLRILHNSLFI